MSLSTALISVDIVAFQMVEGQLEVLTRHSQTPAGKDVLALPAGRIAPEEDKNLDDAACRLLAMMTDQKPEYLEQVVTIGDPNRDSRGWSLTVVYFALIPFNQNELRDDSTTWVRLTDGKPDKPLAYDHNRLIEQALSRLKSKIQYSSLPVYLLPEAFTLSDIQKVYEAVLGKAPPMRSIRNRFLQGDLLIDTGKQRRGSNRPAALYRVNKSSETWLFDRLYMSTRTS